MRYDSCIYANLNPLHSFLYSRSHAASVDSVVSTSQLTINGGRRRTGDETTMDGSISFAPSREKLNHLKSRLKRHDLSQNELELKAALYFHICNPLKRWKVEKLVPYKLVLQVIKTFLLVAQVSLYALQYLIMIISYFLIPGPIVCLQYFKPSLCLPV